MMKLPEFMIPYCNAPAMQRLKHVDMSCGMSYTHLSYYRKGSHNRFDHSVHAAQITWQYSHDRRGALAALFHDISTPAFAHTIDFLNGDALQQESTEKNIADILGNDPDIPMLLRQEGITIEEVSNPHCYPILDTPAPDLCADRLAYLCDDIRYYGFGNDDDITRAMRDITTYRNGTVLCFAHAAEARAFADKALSCFRLYSSTDNRYGMQMLAEMLRAAVNSDVLTISDLYQKDEEEIIRVLLNSPLSDQWKHVCSLKGTEVSADHGLIIDVKKRYIDPWIVSEQKRLSETDHEYRKQLEQYLQEDLTKENIKGIYE